MDDLDGMGSELLDSAGLAGLDHVYELEGSMLGNMGIVGGDEGGGNVGGVDTHTHGGVYLGLNGHQMGGIKGAPQYSYAPQ